nr:InlB B-repeat-containing protein [Lachnospiraceae bacterium]
MKFRRLMAFVIAILMVFTSLPAQASYASPVTDEQTVEDPVSVSDVAEDPVASPDEQDASDDQTQIDDSVISEGEEEAAAAVVIHFDANGGVFEDGSSVSDIEYVQNGSLATLPANPVNGDLVFTGWYLDIEALEVVNIDTYVVDSEVTFYAGWTKDESVSENAAIDEDVNEDELDTSEDGMTLDANGGKFPNGKDKYEFTYLTKYLSDKDYIPDWEGYMFTGWYAEKECTTKLSKDNDLYTLKAEPEKGTTIYAGWSKDFYTVTYDMNGGYFSSYDHDYAIEKTVSYKVPYNTALGNSNYNPSSSYIKNEDLHMKFLGWSEEKDSDKTIYLSSYKPSKDVTLYAVWKEQNYVVTLDANGGYYQQYDNALKQYVKKNEIYKQVKKSGKKEYISTQTPINDNPRMAFAGWYLDKECTQPVVWEDSYGSTYLTLNDDITLFAKWESTNKIVSFDPNGGYYYDYDKKIKSTDAPEYGAAPNKTFYGCPNAPKNDDLHMVFAGWSKDKTGSTIDFPSEDGDDADVEFMVEESDVKFYAIWKSKYTVATFDAGNGTFEYYDENIGERVKGAKTAKFRTKENGELDRYPENPVPNDNNQVFLGWYVGDTLVEYIWNYKVTEDTTFTAKYSSYYTVTLDPNGGFINRWNSEKDEYEEYTGTQKIRVPKGYTINDSKD